MHPYLKKLCTASYRNCVLLFTELMRILIYQLLCIVIYRSQCSGKNEALVKYATMGLPQQVFVSKYLINLPTEKELQKIIEDEKEKRL